MWLVPLHERTPEQTALIAMQGLLEAREAHIARLEVCAAAPSLHVLSYSPAM